MRDRVSLYVRATIGVLVDEESNGIEKWGTHRVGFNTLCKTQYRLMVKYIISGIRKGGGYRLSQDEVDEIFGTAWLKVVKNIKRDNPDSPQSYAWKVAYNAAIDHVRSRARKRRLMEAYQAEPAEEVCNGPSEFSVSTLKYIARVAVMAKVSQSEVEMLKHLIVNRNEMLTPTERQRKCRLLSRLKKAAAALE